jgi:hypothetical protein
MPVDLQVPAHPGYLVQAPKLIPAMATVEAASKAPAESARQVPQ